jgi:hypothetical protein
MWKWGAFHVVPGGSRTTLGVADVQLICSERLQCSEEEALSSGITHFDLQG